MNGKENTLLEEVPSTDTTQETGAAASQADRFLRSRWFAVLFFLLATAAFTWPLPLHMVSSLPDPVDSVDGARQLGQIAHNLLSDPLHIYNSPGLYPLDNDLALNELLVGQGIIAAPIVWLTGNPILAFNALTFLSFVLSGLAAWLLVRHITGSSLAGLAAGVVFAYSPWHYGQYGHIGPIAQQWMVFALFSLVLFIEQSAVTPRLHARKNLLLLDAFALFATVQALAAGYYAYYEAIIFAIYLGYYTLRNAGVAAWLWHKVARRGPPTAVPWRRLGGQLVLLACASLAALAVIYPFLQPYTQAKQHYAFNRAIEEVEYWSGAPTSLLRVATTSWLYAPVEEGLFGLQTSSERAMYPGVAAVALALVGLLANRRSSLKRRVGPGLFAVVALVGLVLSFGPTLHWETYGLEPTGIRLPYGWMYLHVPGFDALRVPQRFDLLVMLGLGACAGFGVLHLVEWAKSMRVTRPALMGTGAVALLMLEFFAPGMPSVPVRMGSGEPPLYRWLASSEANNIVPKDALLLELPVSREKTAITSSPQYMLYDLEHGRPMLNGTPNIVPPGYERLFAEMRRFPTPGTLDIAEGLGVKFLIVHTGGLLNDDKRAALAQEAGPGGRLEMVRTFPDANPDGTPDPGSTAVVYYVRAQPQRFAKLRAAIPESASVFLADHPAHLRLYNSVLPMLIGRGRGYYTNYSTIYSSLVPGLQPAEQGKQYNFAVLYKDDDPAKYGYSRANVVDVGDNDVIQVYRK